MSIDLEDSIVEHVGAQPIASQLGNTSVLNPVLLSTESTASSHGHCVFLHFLGSCLFGLSVHPAPGGWGTEGIPTVRPEGCQNK